MNAGAHGSDVAQVLEKALILYPDGKLSWLSREEMQFSYRTSVLQKERGICVEAVFCLQKGDREEIVRTMQENKTYR
ncbi:hypothetical protein, partial [Escherichia coli]|uniref:hypothetical protein n=1 Tax=Escherichia coli TaxID=562 RepID=UPI0027D2BF0E